MLVDVLDDPPVLVPEAIEVFLLEPDISGILDQGREGREVQDLWRLTEGTILGGGRRGG